VTSEEAAQAQTFDCLSLIRGLCDAPSLSSMRARRTSLEPNDASGRITAMSLQARRGAGAIVLAGALSALGVRPTPAAAPASRVALVRLPTGAIQPQLAVDSKGLAHVIYYRGETAHGRLFHATLDRTGTWSEPMPVNHAANALATGAVRGAHLAIGRHDRVHVAWARSDMPPYPASHAGAPLLYTRLSDAGTAFERERQVTTFTTGVDGGAIAADGSGRVYIVWHGLAPEGPADEDHRRVWMARSTDDGRTFARETSPYDTRVGTCGCCGTAALADRSGDVYVLFRSAANLVHRDARLLVSRDAGTSFSERRLQAWDIGACPMSAFALADAPDAVLAAWETGGQVQWARVDRRTNDVSAIVAAPREATDRKYPAVAENAAGETLFAWVEGASWNKGGALAWQMYDREGHATSEHGSAPGVPAFSFAAVLTRPDGSFAIVY
jgi:hypothetical protein